MRVTYLITSFAVFIALILNLTTQQALPSDRRGPDERDIRELLKSMKSGPRSAEDLAILFHVGDKKIVDLQDALNDPDKSVRLNAQIVIRYLGNVEGMKTWSKNYRTRADTELTGPIPLPLTDLDYEVLQEHYLHPGALLEPLLDAYLFALNLDETPKARSIFRKIIGNARSKDLKLDPARYEGISSKVLSSDNLAASVLKDASFLNIREQKFAKARLIALNGNQDKALMEISINAGPLAQTYYHIVLRRSDQGWKFFSISLIAWS